MPRRASGRTQSPFSGAWGGGVMGAGKRGGGVGKVGEGGVLRRMIGFSVAVAQCPNGSPVFYEEERN